VLVELLYTRMGMFTSIPGCSSLPSISAEVKAISLKVVDT